MTICKEKRVTLDVLPTLDRQRLIVSWSTYPLHTTVSLTLDEARELADQLYEVADEGSTGNSNQENLDFAQTKEAA